MGTTPARLGKYELVECLGHGGMAEVWKALDPQLQRYVAIKVLQPNLRDDPGFLERFRREAQLIASLNHPNIVQIHDFQILQPDANSDQQAPIAYMVMDYVEGQTLADYIRNTSSRGQIPTPLEVVNLFTSICLAINYAHQQGMIHRDIKPANILLDQRNTTHNAVGEPILTDFGVAKLLSTFTTGTSGPQLGTPLYISPEQARGYPGNERSDIYSLGVLLYELVTGVTPFRGTTPLDVITQHVNTTPTTPALINPRIPPALTMVIMRCLAKDPAQRFDSALSLATAVAGALNIVLPEISGKLAYPVDAESIPTHIAPIPYHPPATTRSGPLPRLNPPAIQGSTATPGAVNTPNINFTPIPYATPTPPVVPSSFTVASPLPPPPLAPPIPPPIRHKDTNRRYAVLISILIIVLLGGGLGTYLFLNNQTPSAASSIIGHAFYVSSGQFANGTAEGIADRMQIDLQNVPAPQPNMSYYVWLLADKHPDTNKDQTGPRPIQPPLLLTNNLPVNNGQVHFTYEGDGHNDNLISTTSRILITEESANMTPAAPSTDRATWHYYGEIPQAQIPNDQPGFSALTHIRHLFYNETNIDVLGLPGGLDNWTLKNTEKIFEWAVSARDNWYDTNTTKAQAGQMRQQFIRILDYLDGIPNTQVDMPSGTPVLVDRVSGSVALLTVDPQHQIASNYSKDPPGYIDHIQLHVGQVAQAPDISPAMRQLTARILDEVNRAGNWLKDVHEDDLKLFQASSNGTLLQPTTGALLDQLVTDATYAYIGQLDPTTNTIRSAIIQAHYDIQQLATLTITQEIPSTL